MADQLSARPGYSEHQTGLAIDFSSPEGCRLEECYEDTRAGRWLAKNAQNYGFILRFPKGQQAVTGYLFEPWHYRYLGKDLTARYVASGANTLEEFLGTGAAPIMFHRMLSIFGPMGIFIFPMRGHGGIRSFLAVSKTLLSSLKARLLPRVASSSHLVCPKP